MSEALRRQRQDPRALRAADDRSPRRHRPDLTFDVVLTEIPDKGRVLTGSGFGSARPGIGPRITRRLCARTGDRRSAGGWRCCRSSASSAATSRDRAGRTTGRAARCAAIVCRPGSSSRSGCPSRSSPPRPRRKRATTRTSTAKQPPRWSGPNASPKSNGRRSSCMRSHRSTLSSAGSFSPTRSSSSVSTPTAAWCSAMRRSHPIRPASGRPTTTSPASRRPLSTSSSCATSRGHSGWDKTYQAPSSRRRRPGHPRPLHRGVHHPHRHRLRRVSDDPGVVLGWG